MSISKSLAFCLLFALIAVNCSSPSRTSATPAKPADSDERLSKIKLAGLDGQAVSLKDFAGKPVFLNFWATWCGPCTSEMGSIEKASQRFKDDIVFLAVSNETPALIKSFVKKQKLTFQFAQLQGTYLDVFVLALPTTLLIDGNGQIVEESEGFRNWMEPENLEKLSSLVKK